MTATLVPTSVTPPGPRSRETPLRQQDIDLSRELFQHCQVGERTLFVGTFFSLLAVPSLTRFLENAGTIRDRPLERLGNTQSFFHVMAEAIDQPEGARAIARVRALHERAGVHPDRPEFEYILYALSKGVIDTMRTFSPNPPTPREELAWFRVWREVGRRLGCMTIPEDYQLFCARNQERERQYRSARDPVAQAVAARVLEQALHLVPAPLRPLGRGVVLSLIAPDVAAALALPKPAPAVRNLVHALVRGRAKVMNAVAGMWESYSRAAQAVAYAPP